MEQLTNAHMFAIGWALNASGWLDKPVENLTINRLMGINKKLGGLKFNATEDVKWNEETKQYDEHKGYWFVLLDKGGDIKYFNINVAEQFNKKNKKVENEKNRH